MGNFKKTRMKDVVWVGDSRERLQQFPKGARQAICIALLREKINTRHKNSEKRNRPYQATLKAGKRNGYNVCVMM